jgi:uncharacterized damage-inducible protein DinB
MKKLWLSVVLGILALGAGAPRTHAQNAAAPPNIPMSKPPVTYGYDLRPQVLLDLDQVQQKFIALAEAIPADKYTWRPADGVRSIAEVYLHVAGSNYAIPELIGGTIPDRVNATPLPKLGPEAVKGDVEYFFMTHMREHFGQSIAYAREVGVTPPWTVAAEAEAKKKAAAGKPAGTQPE